MTRIITLVYLLCISAVSFAVSPEIYFESTPPTTTVADPFEQYAVLYNTSTRTAIFSAEKLTAQSVARAKGMTRVNAFHSHKALPMSKTAAVSDYSNSNYDKGHLAPFGDMSSKNAGFESFNLLNIVPQNPQHNRQLWKSVEVAVREIASKKGEVYVITGPILSKTPKLVGGRLPVPKLMFKAIYVPSTGQSAVVVSENSELGKIAIVSIRKFKLTYGINLFPSLPLIKQKTASQLIQIPDK
jgi:endonuclease G